MNNVKIIYLINLIVHIHFCYMFVQIVWIYYSRIKFEWKIKLFNAENSGAVRYDTFSWTGRNRFGFFAGRVRVFDTRDRFSSARLWSQYIDSGSAPIFRLMYNRYNKAEGESGLTDWRRPVVRFPSTLGSSEKYTSVDGRLKTRTDPDSIYRFARKSRTEQKPPRSTTDNGGQNRVSIVSRSGSIALPHH